MADGLEICHQVGTRVRVVLRPGRDCEDMPHKPIEDGLIGTLVRCDSRPTGPPHP